MSQADAPGIETVSAGEVCSIKVAKEISINATYNRENEATYYKDGYTKIKTYNLEVDTANETISDESAKLCQTYERNSRAEPLCPLVPGAGFGFTRKINPSTLNPECVTAECPTGFTPDGNKCIKPKVSKTILLPSRVEERWYDWFMVPNYHLGNKYVKSGDTNYAPCVKGSIPSYQKDPVDGLMKSFNSSAKDELGKCVKKEQYFGGKYLNSDTYCPLAWVYRAGATKKKLKELYLDEINNIEQTGRGTEYLDTLKGQVENIVREDIYEPIILDGFQDYIGKPQTDEARNACDSLDNLNVERKNNAYIICSDIKSIGKDKYIEKLRKENEEKEPIAQERYKRALQACDTLFCNDNKNTEQICFPEVHKKGFDESNDLSTLGKEPAVIDPNIEKTVAVKTGKLLFIISMVFIGAVLLKIFYPLLKKILKFIAKSLGFCVFTEETATPVKTNG